MSTIQGSCLCGEVVFECSNEFKSFHLCHCQQCQKISGSAHASNLFTHPSNIHWIKGEALLNRFDVPGRALSKNFCQHCASAMPFVTRSGKALLVPAGSLDGTPNLSPQDNIFCSEQATWYRAGVSAPCFDRFPE